MAEGTKSEENTAHLKLQIAQKSDDGEVESSAPDLNTVDKKDIAPIVDNSSVKSEHNDGENDNDSNGSDGTFDTDGTFDLDGALSGNMDFNDNDDDDDEDNESGETGENDTNLARTRRDSFYDGGF